MLNCKFSIALLFASFVSAGCSMKDSRRSFDQKKNASNITTASGIESSKKDPASIINFNTAGRILRHSGASEELNQFYGKPKKISVQNDILREDFEIQDSYIIEHAHIKDIISFVDRFYWHRPLVKAWEKNLSNVAFDKLLEEQDYATMFLFVESIKNDQERISYLEKGAAQGHVICMLELCKELKDSQVQSSAQDALNKKTQEISSWYTRALVRLLQDIACHEDSSVGAAQVLMSIYAQILGNSLDETFSNKQKFDGLLNEGFVWVNSLKQIPSPMWVGYHGMSVFNGGLKLIPENKWAAKRQEVLRLN